MFSIAARYPHIPAPLQSLSSVPVGAYIPFIGFFVSQVRQQQLVHALYQPGPLVERQVELICLKNEYKYADVLRNYITSVIVAALSVAILGLSGIGIALVGGITFYSFALGDQAGIEANKRAILSYQQREGRPELVK